MFNSKIIYSFAKLLRESNEMITRMILESFGVDKYFNGHIDSGTTSLRLSKYNIPLMTESDEISFRPHRDQSYMTMLYDNQVNGLEIQRKDGEWITASIPANSFIYMLGDAFWVTSSPGFHFSYVWTNGRLQAAVAESGLLKMDRK
ncbi:hypothetical protein GIB67_018792 [Kingdonia uniflora]|uniref:Isopenicillin N synthase-like Fe(2+) 2OG dioxygenase domain-containing protein n=1 Tax=Kingdonia uniflora TaxID=39325 RepID=A0A7J7NEQ4_9MAGN|nr:hypothetical protein GIB67_018792 [Kingdonia uniflora]